MQLIKFIVTLRRVCCSSRALLGNFMHFVFRPRTEMMLYRQCRGRVFKKKCLWAIELSLAWSDVRPYHLTAALVTINLEKEYKICISVTSLSCTLIALNNVGRSAAPQGLTRPLERLSIDDIRADECSSKGTGRSSFQYRRIESVEMVNVYYVHTRMMFLRHKLF